MGFLSLAQERYSVRKFSDKPVEREKLDLILEAGRVAPTAGNLQPQRILVIESAEGREKVNKCTPCLFGAPMALLVCYDVQKSAKRKFDDFDTGYVDASIVTTHLMLEIADLGLGSTWVAHFDPVVTRKQFELRENLIPVAFLPFGYPAEDAAPNEKMHFSRMPLDKTVSYEHF